MHIEIKKHLNIKKLQGFTLIELLIAIPISMLVLFAVLKIFTSSIQSAHTQTAFGRVQENGRMATELMARDIRGADYWGCMNDISSITNHLDTSDSDYNDVDLVLGDGGIEGSESSVTIDGVSSLVGTDNLTLRGAQNYPNITVTDVPSSESANIKITAGSGIEEGDVILVTDCENADIFTVTNISTNGTRDTVVHNKGEDKTGWVKNATKSLSTIYDTDAQILSPTSKTYFIGESRTGNKTPTLYRSVNGTASELVRGITDLQIMYGRDTTGDGSADTYSNAGSFTDMDNVLTIRVSLTSDSSSDASAASLQRTYTVTSNIRNRTL